MARQFGSPAGWAGARDARQRWTSARFRELEPLSGPRRRDTEEAIVLQHLDLVDGLVRRLAGGYRDQGDLRQVGCIGLVKAVRRFDPVRGDNFVAFAVPTISGEIKRYLRDNGWFIRPPRRTQELRLAIAGVESDLAQHLRREPTATDLAEHLGAPRAVVAEAMATGSNLRPLSLDASTTDEDAPLGATIGVLDDRLERSDLRLTLRLALAQLTPQERRIVSLRFVEERTQHQIAAEIGVTQMQVSRILTRILGRLREELEQDETPSQVRAAS
jgi:RNA polymerase sigma-B factor